MNVEEPVKFMAAYADTAGTPASRASFARRRRRRPSVTVAAAAQHPPATAPLSEKARPGSQGRSSGVEPPPAARASHAAAMTGAPSRRPRRSDTPSRPTADGREDAGVGQQHAAVPGEGQLHGREHGALAQGEGDPAHRGVGLHAGGEERGQVGRPHRSEGDAKAARLLDLVGRDPGRRELRQDEPAVLDDLGEARLTDHAGDLLGAEGALAGGAPDVDAARVDDEQPGVEPVERGAQLHRRSACSWR